MKILSVEFELLHADWWTDGETDNDDANSNFSQFCELTQKLHS
jgi:hypothetical protein